jgi:hypothetical protein
MRGAPLFTVHTARFDDTLAQFDWNLVNRLNPDTVEATQDSESLEQVLYSFVDSKFGAVERQFLPFPLSATFYRLLQLGTDYLLKKLMKAQRQLSQKDREIEGLREKVARSVEALDRVPRMVNTELAVVHSCQVCSRGFKAILYLDRHIPKCHPDVRDAWQSLRDGQPYGLSLELANLQTDIGHLRGCLTRQQLAEREEGAAPSDQWPHARPVRQKTRRTDASGKIVSSHAVAPISTARMFVRDGTELNGPESGEITSGASFASSEGE